MNTKVNMNKFSAKNISGAGSMFSKAMLLALAYSLVLTPDTSFAGKRRPGGGWGGTTNIAPTAKISATSTTGAAPLTSTFKGSNSTDQDGTISSYSWKFGDGSTATGSTASHNYNTAGSYTVSLKVTDNKGATGTATTTISVTAPTPDPDPDPTPTPSPSAGGDRPVGIYSLDKVVDLPYVSGVAIRPRWSDLEKTEGVYDFSSIEKVVREAAQAGQSVTIANLVVGEPTWLMNKVPTANKYQGIWDTDIVPWDETMLAAMEKLAQAESNFKIDGVALKDHPNVKQIDAPVGTANGIRLKTPPKNYTAELYKDGATRSIRMWIEAFPDKIHYTTLFDVADGTRTTSTTKSTAESLRDELLAEFNGVDKPRINFFIEYWTGEQPMVGSTFTDLLYNVKDVTSIMMQSCGSWTGQNKEWASCNWLEPSDSPAQGFDHAMTNFNTTYFEVYTDDLNNSAYSSQFEDAAIKIEEFAATLK